MKILVFNGGPRKGNTWRLTQAAKKYIHKIDNTVDFCEVHLSDVNIPFCTGCSNCFRKGHTTCPHHEKIPPIIDMIEARCIFFGFSSKTLSHPLRGFVRHPLSPLSYAPSSVIMSPQCAAHFSISPSSR